MNSGGLKAKPGLGARGDAGWGGPGDSRWGLGPAPPLLYAISRRRAVGGYSARPARLRVPCHSQRWPRLPPWLCKSATEARDSTLVLMVAAAALAVADPPPAMPPAVGSGGSAARRDFYWLRSFLAGGGCRRRTRSRSGRRGGTWGMLVAWGRDDILVQWPLPCSASCVP